MTNDPGQPLNLDLTRLEDWQLGALIKTVHEARFPDEEWEPMVWLSSFVIDLHIAAICEQRHRKLRAFADRRSRGEDVSFEEQRYEESYSFWARWRGRREHDVVKRRIDASPETRRWFSGLTPEEVRPLFRPFEMDDESADDLIAYAARTGAYRPSTADPSSETARPYARVLTGVQEAFDGTDVYAVAVLRPGSCVLSEQEATSRPEDALRRLGFTERDARDCAQNAWEAVRTTFVGWCGVLPDDVRPDS